MKKQIALVLLLICIFQLVGCGTGMGNVDRDWAASSVSADTQEPMDEKTKTGALPYDANGDGKIETLEFPIPTGEDFGLSGNDAALYTAAVKARIDGYEENLSNGVIVFGDEETMLVLTYLNVFGEYDGDEGEMNYVCGYGAQFYYELGEGLSDPQNPIYSSTGGGGNPALITLAADGTLIEIQETYDGTENSERIRAFCGPLTDLAEALNLGEAVPTRRLTPTGDELLRLYLDCYFS